MNNVLATSDFLLNTHTACPCRADPNVVADDVHILYLLVFKNLGSILMYTIQDLQVLEVHVVNLI